VSSYLNLGPPCGEKTDAFFGTESASSAVLYGLLSIDVPMAHGVGTSTRWQQTNTKKSTYPLRALYHSKNVSLTLSL